jgi:multiple sugar transport system substrate-binding protein
MSPDRRRHLDDPRPNHPKAQFQPNDQPQPNGEPQTRGLHRLRDRGRLLDRRGLFRFGAAALGASTLGGLAAACGRPGAKRSGAGGDDGSSAVEFQGWDFESALVQQNIDRFMKRNPDIDVDYTPVTSAQYVQKIVAEYTGKNEPDALYVYDDSLAAWVGAGYLQPIDDMPGVDKVYDAIYPGNAETMTYDGKRYGLPYYTDSTCLIYNAEILDKAGFSAPPASLDELTAQAGTIKQEGLLEHPIGIPAQLSDTWWSWWWALVFGSEGRMFDDGGKPVMSSSDTVARDVLAWLGDATTKDKVLDPASSQLLPIPLDNAFMAGKYAFTIGARYALRKYNDPQQSKVAGKAKLALMPSLDGQSSGTVSNTRMYCLSATTERKDDAYKLISYLGGYGDDGDLYTAKFWFDEQGLGFAFPELADDPEIKAALEKWADPEVYSQLAEVARPRTVIAEPWYTEYETEAQKAIQRVITGQLTPADAVKSMATTATTLRKQFS